MASLDPFRKSKPAVVKQPFPPVAGIKGLSELTGVKEVLDQFHRDRQWITEQHLELCRIAAPTFFEAKRAEWMLTRLRELGCDAKIDRAGNVIAFPGTPTTGPYVAVTAHLDTVLAPRRPEEIYLEGDGRMHGPGTSDNGAGLAALLAIARAMQKAPQLENTTASLLLVANVGEEGEGNLSGMKYLCRQSPLGSKIRSFLVLDGPSVDHITSEALASRRFEITFQGVGGHSWSDFGVGNPVHALSRAVTLFTQSQAAQPAKLARTSFNFGIIEGGISVNSIPSSALAKLDLRSDTQSALDAMANLLTECVENARDFENSRATAKVSAKIRDMGQRPGGRLPETAPMINYLRAIDTHFNIRSRIDCASTDANIPLSMGLPAVSIGTGGQGGGAHTPAEWYRPEGRDVGLKRIFLALALLLTE